MNIKTLLLCTTLTGLWIGTALAEDTTIPANNDEAWNIDLREEIASPLTGQALIETTIGIQQDFGGLSGNANGMDGFPDATGDSSDYPQNNPESFGQSTTSQPSTSTDTTTVPTTFPSTGGGM